MNTPEDDRRIALRRPEHWSATVIMVDATDYLGKPIRGRMTGNGSGGYTGVMDGDGKIHAVRKASVKLVEGGK